MIGRLAVAALARPAAPGDAGASRLVRRKIAMFLLLVIAFATALDLARLFIPFGSRLMLMTWTPRLADALEMWSVGLAGVITLTAVDRTLGGIGLWPGRPRYLVLGFAIPLIYCAAIYVPIWVLGLGAFAGLQPLLVSSAHALAHLPVSFVMAAGEELGWRGVLVPGLARITDFKRTVLLSGAVWAVWHFPDILFFDYNVGTPPAYALSLFSISVIGLGAVLAWLRLRSGSVWPAIVFHGVHNTVIWGVFDRSTERTDAAAYLGTEFGAGLAAAAVVIGFVCWLNRWAVEPERKRAVGL
jgi:membrane protease YdiL (CAAX protease family)